MTDQGYENTATLTAETGLSLVAGRYRCEEELGSGAFGVVYRARDVLRGRDVALKLLEAGPERIGRIQREVAALRALNVPGVVRLVDDGLHHDSYYLAMDHIVGTHFPGRALPTDWSAIEHTAIALLEALAIVHAGGIVHRDLKPANVLVDEAGTPCILDFGLAGGPAMGPTVTRAGTVLGTPAYLAPEQVEGRRADPRADLYAVGVMLYQALTGRLPHPGDSGQEMMLARLNRLPPPVRIFAPDLPQRVADAIDRALARQPGDRHRSAREFIRQLGRREVRTSEPARQLMGPGQAVESVLIALESGRTVSVAGLPGSGRTRTCQEVAERLRKRAVPVRWLRAGSNPFSGLCDAGFEAPAEFRTLDESIEYFEAEVRAQVATGLVLIADDFPTLDRWTRTVFDRCADAGGLLAVDWALAVEEVPLAPLTVTELRPLFHGPDRLLHLSEDAADVLRQRTHGLPRRVWTEVGTWVRSGLATWHGEKLTVERSALAELAAGVRLAATGVAHPTASGSGSQADAHAARTRMRSIHQSILGWVGLFWPTAEIRSLARARQQPQWLVEGLVAELVDFGLLARLSDGTIGLTAEGASHAELTIEESRQARSAIADLLPVGSERRLVHLVAAERYADVATEALSRARGLRGRSQFHEALALVEAGLAAARAIASPDVESQLLDEMALCALQQRQTESLDRVLYELSRSRPRPTLHGLVTSALKLLGAVGPETLRALETLPRFSSEELESQRWTLALRAARGCEADVERRVLRDATAWAADAGTERAEAMADTWRGFHAYRTGEYRRSADLLRQAVDSSALTEAEALQALNQAAAAELECGRFDEVVGLAHRSRTLAAAVRHAVMEGHAEWLIRTADYRAGRAHTVDHELVTASAALADADLIQLVRLTEATIAWRAGSAEEGITLAAAGGAAWERMNRPVEAALIRALACSLGGGSDSWIPSFRAAIEAPTPGIGFQIAALVANTPQAVEPTSHLLESWSHMASDTELDVRMDVLSPRECLQRLGLPIPA